MGYKKGDKVRYVTDNRLGVMETPNEAKFIGTLGRDFTGIYEGPHDNPRLENWHITTVPLRAVNPENEACEVRINELLREHGRDHRVYVMVHPAMIEPVG